VFAVALGIVGTLTVLGMAESGVLSASA